MFSYWDNVSALCEWTNIVNVSALCVWLMVKKSWCFSTKFHQSLLIVSSLLSTVVLKKSRTFLVCMSLFSVSLKMVLGAILWRPTGVCGRSEGKERKKSSARKRRKDPTIRRRSWISDCGCCLLWNQATVSKVQPQFLIQSNISERAYNTILWNKTLMV